MGWSTPRTWTDGEKPTAGQMNRYHRDNYRFLADLPDASPIVLIARADPALAQSITTGESWQVIEYDTAAQDTASGFDSDNNRYEVQRSGIYLVIASAVYSSLASSRELGAAVASGGNVLATNWEMSQNTVDATVQAVHMDYWAEGTYIYGLTQHTGTSDSDLQNGSSYQNPHLMVYRLSASKYESHDVDDAAVKESEL